MASRVVCMKRFHQQAFLKIGVLLRFCSRDSFWIKALSSLGNTQFSLTSSFESRFSFLSKAFCVNINVHFSINKFFLILAHQPLFFRSMSRCFLKVFSIMHSCLREHMAPQLHNYRVSSGLRFLSQLRKPLQNEMTQTRIKAAKEFPNKIHRFFIQCSVGSPRTAPKQKNNAVWNSTGLLRFPPKILGALTL